MYVQRGVILSGDIGHRRKMKKLVALKYTEKDGSVRHPGDAAATGHTSPRTLVVITNYCINRINANHPRETFGEDAGGSLFQLLETLTPFLPSSSRKLR